MLAAYKLFFTGRKSLDPSAKPKNLIMDLNTLNFESYGLKLNCSLSVSFPVLCPLHFLPVKDGPGDLDEEGRTEKVEMCLPLHS